MIRRMRTLLAIGLVIALAGCAQAAAGSPGASGEPGSSVGPSPSNGAALSDAALKYRLVDQLGKPLFCDPDEYPVARGDAATLARERLPAIRADQPTYAAIAKHLGIDPAKALTQEQTLAVYTDWKMLRALVLTSAGTDAWTFDYIAAGAPGEKGGFHVTGSIDAAGHIRVASREASGPPPCPICLARGTLIATPSGGVPVEALRVGQLVWTADAAGGRVAAPIAQVGSTPVPATHLVVDLVLADGREVFVSPGHPLPDGRPVGDLRSGDVVDGSAVVSADLVPYGGGSTFDLLPAGDTGVYWANGIELASTLARR
jgi:hypothetical protein